MLLISALLAASMLAPAARADEPPALLDLARDAGSFSTLLAAVEAAGLEPTLAGDGPFTVFAPTDAAFAALPEGAVEALLQPGAEAALVALLRNHVVSGRVSAADAARAGEATTLLGRTLAVRFEAGALRVDGARVASNDLQARNGVIHVVDSVLVPSAGETGVAGPGPLEVLVLAVERGAPLFNNGQPAACAALYELACLSVLTLAPDALPVAARDALQSALGAAQDLRDPAARAWELRRGIDGALAALSSDAAPERDAPRPRGRVLFDFRELRAERWLSVNDDVMGGLSRGTSRTTDDGTLLFTGALSLENNGGFSTVRSRAADLELAGWDGLVLRVRGDGRRYEFSALTDDDRDQLHYWQLPFDSVADTWIEVKIPFAELTHRVMGWRIPDGPLDPATIRSLALGISDKQTTPFALEIDWIKTYREE